MTGSSPGGAYATGCSLALGAALLSGLNGSLGRYLLDDGLSAWRFTQLRSLIALAVLAAILVAVRPRLLAVRRTDLRHMLVLGVAMTVAQAAYFFAITRMEIAVALVLQYLYPLLVLAWLRFAHGRSLGAPLWCGMAVALIGSVLVVGGLELASADAVGVAAALASAVAFAVYIVSGERVGDRYGAATTMFWSLAAASALWTLALPLWTFPAEPFADHANVMTALAVGILGTLAPFLAVVAALKRIPAARAAVLLVSEALFGAIFAFALHGERLSASQLLGGALVLGALVALQLRPPDLAAERAPRAPRPSSR